MRKRRSVSVWLPNWPAQRLTRQLGRAAPPEPFLVARTKAQKRLVYAVSRKAAEAGIRADKTVALAQASVAGLTVVEADPDADAAALGRLAVWALRYSPLVTPDQPDGLALDVGGAEHLFGGEAELVSDLAAKLKVSGLTARCALSNSRLLSWALARFAPPSQGDQIIVPEGNEADMAAPLPVAALGMEPATTDAMRRLGFDRIGQLFAAPRAGLALRFGTELARKLDLIVGREPETLEPVTIPELISSRISFAEPIAHTAGVEGALARLADEVCVTLAAKCLGVRILDLRCYRVDGEITTLRVRTAAPSHQPKHLRRLFAETLDRINPGFGIERMELVASLTEKVEARQIGTNDTGHTDLAPLVDKIAARVGRSRVFRMEPTEHDLPERSFRLVRPLASSPELKWDRASRPVQMIVPPEKVEVLALLPDHPPARFSWRGISRRVVRADGPECIFGEWWEAENEIALTRDYYRVEDEQGGRWWLFRARDEGKGTAEWFVHGVFG